MYYQRTAPECPWNSSKEMSGEHLRALCAIRAFIRCSVVSQYRSYKSLSVAMATYGIHERWAEIPSFYLLQRVQIYVHFAIKYYFKLRCDTLQTQRSSVTCPIKPDYLLSVSPFLSFFLSIISKHNVIWKRSFLINAVWRRKYNLFDL